VLDFIYFRGASEPTSRVYRALERFRRQGLERVFDAFPIFYKTVPNEGRRETKKSQSVSVGITQSGNVKNKPNHTARATEDSSSMLYKSGSFRDFYPTTQKSERKAQSVPNEHQLDECGTHFTSSGPHSFAGTHAANKHWCF